MINTNFLKPTKLNWLYIDLNSYFATVEQQIDPNIRFKPVVVVPVESDYTCAIAASYEAKLLGIKTGTKIHEAKKLCKELICIKAKHSIYVEYHKRIFRQVENYLHIDHIFSIDEAACKLTGKLCEKGEAIMLARRIKEAIKKNVGEYINCSIGIAPNRYLAKIATDMQKPDGLIVIDPSDIPHKLFTLKVKDLPGIGFGNHKRLIAAGIKEIKDICSADPKQLRCVLGSVWGERIRYLLHGVDLPFTETKRSGISHSQVLDPKFRNPIDARKIGLSLLLKATKRLRAKDLYAGSLAIFVKTPDKYLECKINFAANSNDVDLSKIFLMKFDKLLVGNNNLVVKKICVVLSNLVNKPLQLSFDNLVCRSKSLKKQNISEAIDILNNKFGKGTISLGNLPKTNIRAQPIAFGFIPETNS